MKAVRTGRGGGGGERGGSKPYGLVIYELKGRKRRKKTIPLSE